MNEVKWNNRFNLGVESIDKMHQRLFSIVGKLIALNEDEAKQQHACREGIKYFKSYTLKHFAEEESYMKTLHYIGHDLHKSLHDDMRFNTLPALEKELEEQNYSPESVRHFIGICIGWLNGHIMIEDYAITGRTTNRWIYNPSEDKLAAMEKAIMQATEELFRSKPELISKHYSGEDFSSKNKLCYRLTYIAQDKKRIQIFIVYEEWMALHTLSALLGKEIKKADKTVLYAIKVLSQQFTERIGVHFQLLNDYKLEKIDMLTFDQLLRTFDKEYPPYSLLFRAENSGYFAFCVKYLKAPKTK